MAVLRLREFEPIHCGSAFAPESRTVTLPQYEMLAGFAERYRVRRGATVFAHGPRNSLVAQNFVGLINLGRHQVEVLPKIEAETSQVRHNLAKMVATTLGLTLHADTQTRVGKVEETILDVMVRLFCDELWKAIRQGIVRRYEVRQDNLVVLRGRLNVPDQVRHNLARPDRLHCTFDEFTADNPLNRALKVALRLVGKVVRTSVVSRSVSELLFCFDDVADVQPDAINWAGLSTDRMSQRYSPLLTMARLFVEGASPDLVSGGGDGFAVLFDMNELFEVYVGCITSRVLGQRGWTVGLQRPTRYLALSQAGKPSFELKPDIVIGHSTGPILIIDTKWKLLDERAVREAVSSADMYQMFAYAHRYEAREVVLLYPHHSGLREWTTRRASYRLEGCGIEKPFAKRVAVATIDLSDLSLVPQQLLEVASLGLPVHQPGASSVD